MGKDIRKSNIELLRIISMIMIIAHHFGVHSGFSFSSISLNSLWTFFLSAGGKIGVDIFMFISGYFLVSSRRIKTKKIVSFIGQVIFYSALITISLFIIDRNQYGVSISNCLGSFFPISTNRWWFVTSYFIIYLFHPFINKSLLALGRTKHLITICIMTVMWSFIPTFIGGTFAMSETAFFLYLYIISAYIALYLNNINIKKGILKGIIIYILIFVCSIILFKIGYNNPLKIAEMNSPFTILCSLFLFIGFKNLEIKDNKIINKIASTTFGTYLLHDYNYSKSILWRNILKGSLYQDSIILIPYSLFAIAIVFVVGMIIETLRVNTIEKLWMKIMMPIVEKIESLFLKWIEKIELLLTKLSLK